MLPINDDPHPHPHPQGILRYYISYKVQKQFRIINSEQSLAPTGIFREGGSEAHQGRACKGGRRVGAVGRELFIFFQKSMKNLQFLIILIDNLQFFPKIFSNFCENWATISRTLEICICVGFGWGRRPPQPANLL